MVLRWGINKNYLKKANKLISMKEIIISSLRGLEDACISEIKDILGVKGKKICDGRVVFKTSNIKKYLDKARTIKKACYFV